MAGERARSERGCYSGAAYERLAGGKRDSDRGRVSPCGWKNAEPMQLQRVRPGKIVRGYQPRVWQQPRALSSCPTLYFFCVSDLWKRADHNGCLKVILIAAR